MSHYNSLSSEMQERIMADRKEHKENPYAFADEGILRRNMDHDKAYLWRPVFVSDIEKIMHNPYYNRYSDKTQVLSGYKNDDISRRALHVQLVSRIARNIGRVLNLNVDLIEAMALGHDIGHTPFGHAGECYLNELFFGETGRRFSHNVHSVRVIDKLVCRNVSLQVLDGILCHNGEMEMKKYKPGKHQSFEEFDRKVEECYTEEEANKRQIASTLEGCVMRISDIIAYLGKDRQDAERVGLLDGSKAFSNSEIGMTNAEIINNMIVNIIEKSYGENYIGMDDNYFEAFANAKQENYNLIYGNSKVVTLYKENIKPMFNDVYYELLKQAKSHDNNSMLYKHHIEYIKNINKYSDAFNIESYMETDLNQVVVDYIASMTDDYFVDLYHKLFQNGKYDVKYIEYFK